MEPSDRALALKRLHDQLLASHQTLVEKQREAHEAFLAASERARDEVMERWRRGAAAPLDRSERAWRMDLESDPWIGDHRPAYTVPVLPLTWLIDEAARAALDLRPGFRVTEITRLESRRWAVLGGDGIEGRTVARLVAPETVEVELNARDGESFVPCATARVTIGHAYPESAAADPGPLEGVTLDPDPYEAGDLFHGPSLQLMSELEMGRDGSRARVDATSRGVPYGVLHPGLLDACLHVVPFPRLERWFPGISPGKAGFPLRIRTLALQRELPRSGTVRVEARAAGVEHELFPRVRFWLSDDAGPLATFELTIVTVPMGPLAGHPGRSRRRFLEGGGAVKGLALGVPTTTGRELSLGSLASLDWIPGSVARVYGLDPSGRDLPAQLAARDHLSQELGVHPSRIRLEPASGRCLNLPLNDLRVEVEMRSDQVVTRLVGSGALDLAAQEAHWTALGVPPGLLKDLMKSLIQRFVRRVVLEDPDGLRELAGRPVLYLANHQTGIESLPFCILMVGILKNPVHALTTKKQQSGVIGHLTHAAQALFGPGLALRLHVFEAETRETLHPVLEDYRQALSGRLASLYVAVEGQRAYRIDHSVSHVSSVFLDLALEHSLPIVPVKFTGGLPREEVPARLDFPYMLGKQDQVLGRAIMPEILAAMPYGDRRRYLLHRINHLGPLPQDEEPLPPEPDFPRRVAHRCSQGLPEMAALVIECLAGLSDPCDETRAFLEEVSRGGAGLLESTHPLIRLLISLMMPSPEGNSA